MAVGSQQYAVTGTASVIAAAPGDALPGSSQPIASASVTITTSANAFLGGAGVTSANGLPITSAMAPLTFPLFPGDVLYAVASTTATLNVLQT